MELKDILMSIDSKLDSIQKSIDYNSQLLGEMFMQTDETRASTKEQVEQSMSALRDVVLKHSSMKDNPEMASAIRKTFESFPFGGKR